jgi:excisionase family DNA binding protein
MVSNPEGVVMETVLLKVPEVMERLGCGHTKVYELMSSGELRSVRYGGCRRVPSDELDRFLAGLDNRTSEPAARSPETPQPALRGSPSTG